MKEKNTRLQESYNSLLVRFEALETSQRRNIDVVDVSEEEEGDEEFHEENEETEELIDPEEQRTLNHFKAVKGDK